MHTRKLVIGTALLVTLSVGVGVYMLLSDSIGGGTPVQSARSHKDATYIVQGVPVTLQDGVSEVEAAPGSATKVVTRYFGNELVKDVNGDGLDDITFLVTQETGGSGTFFYAVTALQTEEGYIGSEALFLGDRIAPQSTVSGEGNSVVVNYADHSPDVDLSTPPSSGKSTTILLNPATMELGELVVDFEGESDRGGKIKADVFSGTLESVNTNGLIDPEYFVVVDGKHITTFIGMSRDAVGTVQIDDLKAHIGEQVEVYAQKNEDGTYTLYGSEGFYIKPIGVPSSNGDSGGSDGDVGGGSDSTALSQFIGKTFMWEKTVEKDGNSTTPKMKDAFAFTIDAEGRISIKTDCNSYSGETTLTATTITIGLLMSTMMFCDGSQEADFTSTLASVSTYRFVDTSLILSGKGGRPEVWFREKEDSVKPLPPITHGGCTVGGCSGQLCVDPMTGDDRPTTCVYSESYACYHVATCERQSDGECGWTMTPELTQCLNSM
jgi:heat shock protein HslJ